MLTPNLEPWRQDSAGMSACPTQKPVRAVDLVATRSRPHPSLIFGQIREYPLGHASVDPSAMLKFCLGPRPQINCLRSHIILLLVCFYV